MNKSHYVGVHTDWWSTAKKCLCVGVIVGAIFFLAEKYCSETAFARHLQIFSYKTLKSAHRMSSDAGEVSDNPVQIVDISHLLPERVSPTEQPFTNPELLRTLIAEISRHNPAAIGIDIDMSPLLEGEKLAPTPRFEAVFTNLPTTLAQRGMKIYVGVGRTAGAGPEFWLYPTNLADQAAWIALHPDHPFEVPLYLKMGSAVANESGTNFVLPSLALALATAHERFHGKIMPPADGKKELGPWDQFFEYFRGRIPAWVINHRRVDGLGVREVSVPLGLVDFGYILRLRERALVSGTNVNAMLPEFFNSEQSLEGRIVLLGDIKAATVKDSFPIPTAKNPQPGVLVHGAGAATLVNGPMYELNHGLSRGAGFLFLVVTPCFIRLMPRLVSSYFRGWRAARAVKPVKFTLAPSIRVTLLAGLLWGFVAVLFAWVAVVTIKVLWLDLFLVLLFIPIHALMHIWIESHEHLHRR